MSRISPSCHCDMHRGAEKVADSWRQHDDQVCPTCHGTGRVPKPKAEPTAEKTA